MMSDEELLAYQGHIVPQSFSAGFVILSYFISLIGATSTLELINRRTGVKGLFNNLLLGSAAATMGGVAIWSMHFIGNRAIHMGNGETPLQIAFSPGFTVLSFFVPIIVLWGAFLAIGTNDAVSWWRIGAGGLLCGTAVCGMHYLGNASIQNYTCVYKVGNVIGSAIIAVAASTVALSTFFVFRAMWANAWWKRLFSGGVMAGAVSGMHWCAAVGTQYRLVTLRNGIGQPSRNATVIVVICLSVSACVIIASLAVIRARNMSKSARQAQQVTLSAAIFDKQGRILVDPDGLIPSTIITDSFVETNEKEGFGIGHPLYHWMFQASRNWSAISSLAGGIKKHLVSIPESERSGNGRMGMRIMNPNEDEAEEYGLIFRELFCVAAMTLAERLREDLTSAGILWDEILPTGATGRRLEERQMEQGGDTTQRSESEVDLEEKGTQQRQQYGRGSLMFLVRQLKSDRDADRLAAAGYRFADVHQVSNIIASNMQIQSPRVEMKFRDMATYASQSNELENGVHFGLFGIRARVNGAGFDVLVRRGAKNLLPSTLLQSTQLEPWQKELLRRFDGASASMMLHTLRNTPTQSELERVFVRWVIDSIQQLQTAVQNGVVEDAIFTAEPVALPSRSEGLRTAKSMFAFRLVIPIHSVVNSPDCEFIPLSFFKTHQLSSNHDLAFIQGVHREFGRVTHDARQRAERRVERRRFFRTGKTGPTRSRRESANHAAQEKPLGLNTRRGSSAARSSGSGSTVNLFQPGTSDHQRTSGEAMGETGAGTSTPGATSVSPSYGGIMVSQEVTVDVENAASVAAPYAYQSRPQMTERSASDDHVVVVNVRAPAQKMDTSSPEDGIEMRYLGSEGAAASGARVEGHNIARDYNMPGTFVDVLFKHCVDGRRGKM